MAAVLKALALYNNEAEDNDELSFQINDELTVIKENWQNGWHLCQLGDKRGVAPANYLQILANLTPNLPSESIYDSPRVFLNNNNSVVRSLDNYMNTCTKPPEDVDTYVYPDYQNLSDDEDIYQNTSMMSLNTSSSHLSTTHRTPPPSRPVPTPESSPPRNTINYPAEIPKYNVDKSMITKQISDYMDMPPPALTKQISDYMDMGGGLEDDYDEVPEADYDVVPVRSSNESMRSSNSAHSMRSSNSAQIYPLSPVTLSSESLQSNKSSSSKHGRKISPPSSTVSIRKESPPLLPAKQQQSYIKYSPKEAEDETSDYMIPPSARLNVAIVKRRSDHDYFHPPSPISPDKPPLIRSLSDVSPSEVVDVVELFSNMQHSKSVGSQQNGHLKLVGKSSPGLDKRKKKSTGVDHLPRIFNTLTLKRNKHHDKQSIMDTLSRPLPKPPVKTSGEVTSGPHKKIDYKERPLPAPPDDHETQDYAEIQSDEENGPDYADVQNTPPSHPTPHPAFPYPASPYPYSKPAFERQRSRSVISSPFSVDNVTKVRRHSSPTRPDLDYDEDDDKHDYTEVPDISPNFLGPGYHHGSNGAGNHGTNGNGTHHPASYISSQSISSTESTNSGGSSAGYPAVPAHFPSCFPRPALPTTRPPTPPSQRGTQSTCTQRGTQPTCTQRGTQPAFSQRGTQSTCSQRGTQSTCTQRGVRAPHGTCSTPQDKTQPGSVYSPETLAQLPTTTYTTAPLSPTFDKPAYKPLSPTFDKPAYKPSTDQQQEISDKDKELIRTHCGVISTTLLRPATESLIKLKHCTDNKLHEHYIDVCKSTAASCIEIVKHLTVLVDKADSQQLSDSADQRKQQLRDVLKELIEAIKVAKVQFPAIVAHNHMIGKRNELITCIKNIKTYVVKLLQSL